LNDDMSSCIEIQNTCIDVPNMSNEIQKTTIDVRKTIIDVTNKKNEKQFAVIAKKKFQHRFDKTGSSFWYAQKTL
jgi:hypothetical protein